MATHSSILALRIPWTEEPGWLHPWACKELDTTELLSLMTIGSVMPSNHLIFYHPLFFLPSIFPRVFSNESTLQIRWLKYWCFSFSISPSNEYSGLISFRIDWFNACNPRGTQESSPTPQFKSINSLALSLLYSPTLTPVSFDKTIALTIWTFVSKVMSLLFNMLSRFVIAFLPRSKCLLISSLQVPSAVTLEPKKRKFVTA